jgi:hypothetical protein
MKIFRKIVRHHVKVPNKMKIHPKLLNKNIKHSYAKIFPKKVVAAMVINVDSPTDSMN